MATPPLVVGIEVTVYGKAVLHQATGVVQLPTYGVSPFARQVAGMVLHCATILATCFATATTKDSPESIIEGTF